MAHVETEEQVTESKINMKITAKFASSVSPHKYQNHLYNR